MSKIQWTQETWNPVAGCSVVSPGCTNCYAMRMAGTRLKHTPLYRGLTQPSKAGPVWTGDLRRNEKALTQPLRWKKPRKIFVNSMSDLFHENMPDEWIDLVFAVMALTPQHTYQILTKRPERMRKYFSGCGEPMGFVGNDWTTLWHRRGGVRAAISEIARRGYWERLGKVKSVPLPNVWLGTSIERREEGLQRAWELAGTPAAVRFWSVEPLLADLGDLTGLCLFDTIDGNRRAVNWVIVGGESGPNARPMNPDWARSIRDQCQAAGVPFFMKQMARKEPIPDDLMIREYPNTMQTRGLAA